MSSFPSRAALRFASLGAGLIFALQASAQNAPPAEPAQAPVAPIGAGLIRPNAALPAPNPNLNTEAALPTRRGFIRAEPVFLFPFLGVGFGHNDNLTGVRDNPISSSFWVLSPRLTGEMRSGGHVHSLTYAGNFGRYTSSSPDDFNEHELVASTRNQFTARADLTATAFWLDKQDPRGSVNRPLSAEPDEYNAYGANATFGYGARTAQGRLEFDLGLTDKEYRNNRAVTQPFDVSTLNLAGRFFYRLAPRTRALTEIRHTDYDYKGSGQGLDNNEQRYLVGLTWDLAAATSGTVKLGWMTKDFDNPALKDYSGANIEGAVRWAPLSYSVFDFAVRRAAVDSTGTGFFSVDTTFAASWSHRWRDYLASRVVFSHVDADFRGSTRKDKVDSISIGGYFDIRRWLRLGAEVSHQRRDSTDGPFDFSRNLLLFTVGVTL